MSAFVADWLNLLLRWAHLIAGIGWIGTSFYFVALDFSLRKRAEMTAGVAGTAWEVHGGGFYHVEKYLVAPPDASRRSDLVQMGSLSHLAHRLPAPDRPVLLAMPRPISSIRRFCRSTWQTRSPSRSAGLIGGWFVYDALCRSPLIGRPAAARRGGFRADPRRRRGASRMSSPGAARSSMSARSSARSWQPTSSR